MRHEECTFNASDVRNGHEMLLHNGDVNVHMPPEVILRCMRESYAASRKRALNATVHHAGAQERQGVDQVFTPKVWARIDARLARAPRPKPPPWLHCLRYCDNGRPKPKVGHKLSTKPLVYSCKSDEATKCIESVAQDNSGLGRRRRR